VRRPLMAPLAELKEILKEWLFQLSGIWARCGWRLDIMFTGFHILELLGFLSGGALGAAWAGGRWGVTGSALGLVAGALAGWQIAKIPFLVAWYLASARRRSTGELREQLRNPGVWPYHHVVLSELKRRGEPIDGEWPLVRNSLSSNDVVRRIHGWHILSRLFPELASQIPEFNPRAPTEICKATLSKVTWPPTDG